MFLTNLTVDFFIISVCQLILKYKVFFFRILLGALFGSLYATVFYFISLPFFLSLIFDIISLLITVFIVFGYKKLKNFIICNLLFLGVSLAFGAVTLLIYFFTPLGSVFYLFDGRFYFDLSFTAVFLIAFFFAALCFFISKTKPPCFDSPFSCEVTVTVFGKSFVSKALCDTGNSLTEGFYGFPVIICDHSVIAPALPDELKSVEIFEKTNEIPFLPPELLKKLRTVFAKTAAGNKMLFAFPVDSIKIKGYGNVARQAVIAVSTVPLGKYPVLLNPSIFL